MGRDLMPSLNKSRYAMMIPGVNLSSSRGSAVMYYHLYSTHTHVPLFIAVRKCISVFLCAGMKANALGVQYTPIRQQHIFQPRLSRARCDAPSHSIPFYPLPHHLSTPKKSAMTSKAREYHIATNKPSIEPLQRAQRKMKRHLPKNQPIVKKENPSTKIGTEDKSSTSRSRVWKRSSSIFLRLSSHCAMYGLFL